MCALCCWYPRSGPNIFLSSLSHAWSRLHRSGEIAHAETRGRSGHHNLGELNFTARTARERCIPACRECMILDLEETCQKTHLISSNNCSGPRVDRMRFDKMQPVSSLRLNTLFLSQEVCFNFPKFFFLEIPGVCFPPLPAITYVHKLAPTPFQWNGEDMASTFVFCGVTKAVNGNIRGKASFGCCRLC